MAGAQVAIERQISFAFKGAFPELEQALDSGFDWQAQHDRVVHNAVFYLGQFAFYDIETTGSILLPTIAFDAERSPTRLMQSTFQIGPTGSARRGDRLFSIGYGRRLGLAKQPPVRRICQSSPFHSTADCKPRKTARFETIAWLPAFHCVEKLMAFNRNYKNAHGEYSV